ncbi:MAG: phosphopyruvate hydratase [SAR202 cluster bacterium]|nr:phosphopyruvate hydratase [Chloroflexota bacterium]MQG80450.1 phosphopyruvate hydratase [SAR202 cluster bacterium]GIS82207.1 MAG: enolase [Dehalococcoidia bacterium]
MTAKTKISSIHAREVLDSRGNPTVEVDVSLEGGGFGRAIVASGASTGTHEALELRDNDIKRYDGKGVLKAVSNVNDLIAPQLVASGLDSADQASVDNFLTDIDGTRDKSKLGANSLLGISMASAHALANAVGLPLYRCLGGLSGQELPVPMVNIISGGQHGNWSVDLQDFLVIPVGASSYKEALIWCSDVRRAMWTLLVQRGKAPNGVADEGGLGPLLSSNEEALELMVDAFTLSGHKGGLENDVAIGLDVAANEFYEDKSYVLHCEDRRLTVQQMISMQVQWTNSYPILSIEDPLYEDDWEGWRKMTEYIGADIQIIGDDLFTTNVDRIKKGIEESTANAVLVKLNQIGTVSETLEVIDLAKKEGLATVVSARSGETEDTTIADLAVATGAGQIKIGSLTRSERLAKYNQLLRIEDQLGSEAKYNGRNTFGKYLS